MLCPVCHGSGLSPATAFFDRVVPCGGCKGSGWLPDADDALDYDDDLDEHLDEDVDDGDDVGDVEAVEPEGYVPPLLGDLSRWTGAFDASTAFQRHLERIFGTEEPEPADEPADEPAGAGELFGIGDLRPMQRLLDLDRRHLRELANTLPGRAEPATETRLVEIVDGYRRLRAGTHGGVPGAHPDTVDRKLADALRTLGQTRESLHDPDGAEEAYEEARTLYQRLGAADESEALERSLRGLRLHRDRDVDATIDDLRERLDTTTDEIDRAGLLIELAEISASRHDDLEAETLFRQAEQVLEPHRDEVTGGATADALVSSLSLMMRGETPTGMASIETVMRVRGLLQRVYAGLTQVLAEADPAEAQRYLERRQELEGSTAQGSTDNADFTQRMTDSLQGLLADFDRFLGGSDDEP